MLKSEKQELEQWLPALAGDQFLTSIVGSSELPITPAPGYLVPLAFLGHLHSCAPIHIYTHMQLQ